MRTPQATLSLLALLSLFCTQLQAADLLIDNCDSAASWRLYNGATVSGTVRSGAGGAVKISHPAVAVGGASPSAERAVNGTFYPSTSTDSYGGLRFWVKGDGSSKWGNVELIHDASYMRIYALFPVSTTWTEVTLPWREFVQRNFAGPIELNYKKVHSIRFTNVTNIFPGIPYQPVPAHAYEIDDIRMVGGITLSTTPKPSGVSIANTVAKLKAKQPVKIVVVGASIAHGNKVSFPATDPWPYKLQERLKATYGYSSVSVLNKAIGGHSSHQGGGTLGWFCYDQEPIDLLIICDWCYNDFSTASTKPNGTADIVSNYQNIMGSVLRRGHFELMAIHTGLHCEAGNFNYMDGVYSAIKTLCSNMNVYSADVYGAFKVLGQPYLTANYYTFANDYVHHNATAHTHASQIIHDAIVAAGSVVNQAPVANSQSVSTTQNTAKAITLSGSDPEGSALSYSIVSAVVNGTLAGTPPSVTYTPRAGFTGSDSFTFRVSDGTLLSNTATVSITVVAPAGQPELPRVYLDTTLQPSTGRVISVAAGGDLQAAINAAVPGDTVSVAAGATFYGNFYLPEKTGSGWVTIRSSAPDTSLPPPGTRITPTYASVLPKLVTTRDVAALRTSGVAHHYRMIGLEITTNYSLSYGLVALGAGNETATSQLPHDIIIDRCYIHGVGSAQIKNGISLNSASTAVIDSYIDECHANIFESKCIGCFNGPGPYKIVNNFLGGCTIQIMFGGAKPSITGLIPSDIEFRRNHCFRPLSYRPSDPSYGGINWGVKNLFELKFAQRVLIEGNTFENNWPHEGTLSDNAPQHGWAILFTVRDQGGTMPWAVVQDVTVRHNIIRRSNCGISFYGLEGQGARRIKIENNLLHDIGTGWGNNDRTGMFAQVGKLPDLIINHNTCYNNGANADIIFATSGTPPQNSGGFVFTNNILNHGNLGMNGAGTTTGFPTLNTYFSLAPSYVCLRNAMMSASNRGSVYPTPNYFPTSWSGVGFTDIAGKNFRLLAGSPYKALGTDGKDLGYDHDALSAAMNPPAPPDTTPPLISGVAATSLTTSSATIVWNTNEASDTQVEYGTTTSYGTSTTLNATKVTAHSQGLSALAASTLYHYRVKSRDAAGNLATSGDFNFTTAAVPNRAPLISSAAYATPNPAAASQVVSFSVAATDADGDALTYSWSFGDGTNASGASVTHSYSAGGNYTATASVSDGKASLTSSVVVVVTAPGSNSVTVTKNGQPLVGVSVHVYSSTGTYLNVSAWTNSLGKATFTTLAGGLAVQYRVATEGATFSSPVVTTPQDTGINVPANTVVTVQKAGLPLSGVYVYAYDSAGTYLNYVRATNSAGQVVFALASSAQFKFRVSDQGAYFWSALITAPATTTIALPASSTVTVSKGGLPLSAVYVYAYDAAGNYLNYARQTNAAGQALFTLASATQVKFRVSDQGAFFWSALVTPPTSTTIALPANSTVTVTKGGLPLSGVYVYACDAAGTYLNYARQTDASGKANFALAVGRQVKFRLSDQGAYFWSALITAPNSAGITVPANTTVTVQQGTTPVAGVYVYAYTAAGVSLGYARQTNASGQALFSLAANQQVKFTVTVSAQQYWSTVITPPVAVTITTAAAALASPTAEPVGAAATPEPDVTAAEPEAPEPSMLDLGVVQVGKPFRMKLELPEALAGQKRISWKLDSAQLPPGVKFSRGKLAGRPTAPGQFVFSVLAEVSSKTIGANGKPMFSKQSVQLSYELTVAAE